MHSEVVMSNFKNLWHIADLILKAFSTAYNCLTVMTFIVHSPHFLSDLVSEFELQKLTNSAFQEIFKDIPDYLRFPIVRRKKLGKQ